MGENPGENTYFTTENSAILRPHVMTQIFCGDFAGDIPSDVEPDTFTLHLSWKMSFQDFTATSTDFQQAASGELAPSAGVIVSDVPSSIAGEAAVETASTASPESIPADAVSTDSSDSTAVDTALDVTTETPSDTSTEVSTPVDALRDIVAQVEVIPATENAPTQITTSAPPLTEAPAETASLEAGGNTDEAGDFLAGEKTISTESPNVPDAFLEVSYTTDGTTWHSLGVVGDHNWQHASFPIPITSWKDMQKMQIGISRMLVAYPVPYVYLDAMKLEAEYTNTGANGSVILQAGVELIELLSGEDAGLQETTFDAPNTESVEPATPVPGALSAPRTFTQTFRLDPDAKHYCAVEPFRIDISRFYHKTAEIYVRPSGPPAILEIGDLPEGVDMRFSQNNAYAYHLAAGETRVALDIQNSDGAFKGDVNIPIFFTERGVTESTIACQINIVNTEIQ